MHMACCVGHAICCNSPGLCHRCCQHQQDLGWYMIAIPSPRVITCCVVPHGPMHVWQQHAACAGMFQHLCMDCSGCLLSCHDTHLAGVGQQQLQG
jgi:hypothetical protein